MFNSLPPSELKHTRLICPPLSPRVCLNSCPLSQWCYLFISSSTTPFSFCLQSFPTSGSFPVSCLFPSGGQSIEALPSTSVLPMNIQGWFPLAVTGLISLKLKGLSRVFSSTTIWKHQFLSAQPSLWSNSHHPYMTTGKTIALTRQTFVSKVKSLLYNTLSRFVIAFLPSRKHLLISWLQSPSAVILEPKKINLSLFPLYSLPICHEVMGLDAMILVFGFFFLMLSFKPAFSLFAICYGNIQISCSSNSHAILSFVLYRQLIYIDAVTKMKIFKKTHKKNFLSKYKFLTVSRKYHWTDKNTTDKILIENLITSSRSTGSIWNWMNWWIWFITLWLWKIY